MHNLLDDCPFASTILSLPQPERLLLLGSGISHAPKEWLDLPGLELVRFNAKSLTLQRYQHVPTYAVVCWKKTQPWCEEHFRGIFPRPYIIVLDENVSPLIDLEAKQLIIDDGHREHVRDVGSWFAGVSETLSTEHRTLKIYTTGFYMTLWLLGGYQKEIFIAGFDGYLQQSVIAHADEGYANLPFDNKHHDYNGEWRFIERAITIAQDRGVKVHLARI